MILFNPGDLNITPGAAKVLKMAGVKAEDLLERHQNGDWGDESEEDQREITYRARYGMTIYAMYKPDGETEVWVITAEDRSATMILLPDEYQRLEVSTQEGYARWAASYNKDKNPLIAVEESAVTDMLNDLPITRALDVGTGTGRYALKLAERGTAVIALDQSPEMLAIARQAAAARQLPIGFVLANIHRLPLRPAQFDLLVCALVLSHIPDLDQAFTEFGRMLLPGGHLYITMFHPDSIAFGWRTGFSLPAVTVHLPNETHSVSDYLNKLKANHFEIREVRQPKIRDVPAGYLPARVVRERGEQGLCLAILARRR